MDVRDKSREISSKKLIISVVGVFILFVCFFLCIFNMLQISDSILTSWISIRKKF